MNSPAKKAYQLISQSLQFSKYAETFSDLEIVSCSFTRNNFVKELIPAYFSSTGVSDLEIFLILFTRKQFREGAYPGLFPIYRG